MKTRFASVAIVAALLSCLGSLSVSACGRRIDLVAIQQRISDPGLQGDLKERANALKTSAAAAIEAGHRDEGRRMYYQLMELLGIPRYAGRYHCG